MRFVHTSDWHLGKRLCDASLLEDQAYALDQILQVCRDSRADALVVAGDIYDRAVPPIEAVQLLGDFLGRVGIPTVIISGNHDSPDRLGFASGLIEKGRVHLRTSFDRRAEPVVVEAGRKNKLHLYCLPYLEPEVARAKLGDDELVSHERAVRASLAAMHEDRLARRAEEAVLVAHLFAAGAVESRESERPLVVGGVAHVPPAVLGGWSYVALGHLHAPQGEGIRYSGSPLKYSFEEARHDKGVSVVDLVCGRPAVRHVSLTPRRDLVRIEGTFQELMSDARFAAAEPCLVEATYTDEGYVVDAAARLRQRYPHLLAALPRQILRQVAESPHFSRLDPGSLLDSFWQYVEGDDAAPYAQAFADALERAQREPEACALAS